MRPVKRKWLPKRACQSHEVLRVVQMPEFFSPGSLRPTLAKELQVPRCPPTHTGTCSSSTAAADRSVFLKIFFFSAFITPHSQTWPDASLPPARRGFLPMHNPFSLQLSRPAMCFPRLKIDAARPCTFSDGMSPPPPDYRKRNDSMPAMPPHLCPLFIQVIKTPLDSVGKQLATKCVFFWVLIDQDHIKVYFIWHDALKTLAALEWSYDHDSITGLNMGQIQIPGKIT